MAAARITEPAAAARRRPGRLAAAIFGAGAVWGAMAAPASGHAVVRPPDAQSATLQVFSLSVPTEREGEQTTAVRLTVPDGFAIDSFAPSPGWRRRVSARGRGDAAVVTTVTWTGGSTPNGEDAVFRFNATATDARTYTFDVRQTYLDGTVVDWTGPEASDTPAPRVEAETSLGGGGSSTLATIAFVIATLALVAAAIALLLKAGEGRDLA